MPAPVTEQLVSSADDGIDVLEAPVLGANIDGGISLEGSMNLTFAPEIDITSVSGQKQVLNLLLKQQNRGAANFATITHAAHIRIFCNLNQKLSHSKTSDQVGEDDAFNLAGFSIFMGDHGVTGASAPDAAQVLDEDSAHYNFNIHDALIRPDDAGKPPSTLEYNANSKEWRGKYITAGAVVIDMNGDFGGETGSNLGSLQASQVAIRAANAGENDDERTFYASKAAMECGVLCFVSPAIENCDTKPTLNAHATFNTLRDGSTLLQAQHLMHADGNSAAAADALAAQRDGIQIALNAAEQSEGGLDDKALAQVLTIDASGLVFAEAADPTALTPDDFVVNLTLSDLTEGTAPNAVKTAVQTAVQNAGKVLKGFKVTVNEQLGNATNFSKMCVQIDKLDAAKTSPLRDADGVFFIAGDKFVLNDTKQGSLNMKAFGNTFQGAQGANDGLTGLARNMGLLGTKDGSALDIVAVLEQVDVTSANQVKGAPLV